jgi:YesN/AraC family two-component response regulator
MENKRYLYKPRKMNELLESLKKIKKEKNTKTFFKKKKKILF